jgi:hypothetical protein
MAAAMFAASAAVLTPPANVPLVALVQPLLPGAPVVTTLQTKLLAVLLSVRLLAGLPSVVLAMVTTLPVADAVTPTAANELLQALMAFARFEATMAGLELTLKVPVVALVQAFVPAA